jgi:SAM-dependent methyltransferase|tara:strand:- start:2046 stop:2612 length:567 start_codon:yes stop_codon:yes gene_type:complete
MIDWQKQYEENNTPWNYHKLDDDLKKYFKNIVKSKTILDLGCGDGTQSFFLQKLGFKVKSTDIVEKLKYKLKDFSRDDILDTKIKGKFDYIIDRGLLHNIFVLSTVNNYFTIIKKITKKNSRILLKVLSPYEVRFHHLANQSGPYRFSEKQLESVFGDNFKLESIRDTYYYSNIKPYLRAYFCVYKRV